ncbi:MAG: hypothetical protein PVJ43_13490 [Gemmatimonadales bacterium]|jgi:hypothetical protein
MATTLRGRPAALVVSSPPILILIDQALYREEASKTEMKRAGSQD